MYIEWQTIILIGGVITALGTMLGLILKVHNFVIEQNKQSEEIEKLKEKVRKIKHTRDSDIVDLKKYHDTDVAKVMKQERAEFREVKEELQLLNYSVLACLKTMATSEVVTDTAQITDAIEKIEKHLNEKAHKSRRNDDEKEVDLL